MSHIKTMNPICAFGSDFRESYKADIYKSLTLPQGAILHYRYKFRYVSQEILDNPSLFRGDDAVLFFSHILPRKKPKPFEIPEIERAPDTYKNHSIRWAKIHKIVKTDDTELLHVYFRLGDFCDIELDDNDAAKQPGKIFFGAVKCKEGAENLRKDPRQRLDDENRPGRTTWANRIKELSDYFPKLPFFYIKNIKTKNKIVEFKYDKHTPSCYYPLAQGTDYVIELAVSNIKETDVKIKICEETGELIINHSGDIQTTVQFDDYNIPIFTKPLSTATQSSVLRVNLTKEDKTIPEYETSIDLKLRLSLREPLKFGLFSLLGAGSLLAVAPRTQPFVFNYYLLGASAACFTIAAGFLFYFFNKK
ncbi:hypothetical protein G7008_00860 [Pseudomonas psychrotolerans]|uniref:hypothetical protein n=1 Tax=Pseudomonas TaxID=286 RepID=UPI00104E801E|nr:MULTISPECIES: hypothetical protein [Pseudomonas]EIO9964384.1 hypothetical protein [Listeria monocytogenes]DAH99770.1 MAG TPA: hypothetical protein [Caudoviricetes sp.]MBA1179040.1 hypothetical protein [Pseudomonas psychrotolerans]MBA1212517.1 hypothetical protein [Pseudomonas psychrotolerans]TCQ85453.1 hypothetical protein EC839_110185 [Pseudomonas sp. JUb52]